MICDNDTRIDHERYNYDNRPAQPIEYVYIVFSDSNEIEYSSDDYDEALEAYHRTVNNMFENEDYQKVELCKADRELFFSFNEGEYAYRQSETIEHATLNLTENE